MKKLYFLPLVVTLLLSNTVYAQESSTELDKTTQKPAGQYYEFPFSEQYLSNIRSL